MAPDGPSGSGAGGPAHRVGRVRFEVRGGRPDLIALQQALKADDGRAVAAGLDAAFSEVAGADTVLSLDRLEIDLGAVDPEGVSAEAVAAAARAALADALPRARVRPDATARAEPLGDALAAALGEFLATGRLGWRAAARDRSELEAAILAAAPADLPAFARAARPALVRDAAARRLLLQFGPAAVRALLEAIAAAAPTAEAARWRALAARVATEPDERVAAAVRALADGAAGTGGQTASDDAAAPEAARKTDPETVTLPADQRRLSETGIDAGGDAAPIPIRAAGVVLLHVFLPQLFRHVQLLADDRRFHDDKAAIVAVGLLAYLAEGAAEIDEAEAPLARFLTGLPPDVPLPRRVELPPAAIVAADALLDAAIAHWDRIGATSAAGLREAFLMRPGMLRIDDAGGARLRLERRGFDMLLDSLPWSISIVRLPWMTGPLYVDWR